MAAIQRLRRLWLAIAQSQTGPENPYCRSRHPRASRAGDRHGSMTSPQALVGAAATPPTTGTEPTTAEVMRQGAARIEQPDKARSAMSKKNRMDPI
jgi:hypothetical protein